MEIKEEIPLLSFSEKLKLMRWLADDVDAEAGSAEDIDEAENDIENDIPDEAELADEARWHEKLREDFRSGGPMSQLAAKAREEFKRGETLPGWP